jgi:deoxyribodipyrimidine photo-lyase
MHTAPIPAARIRFANGRPANARGKYVLYWAQMFRRLHANHALDCAIALAAEHRKPLVVYEGLKLNYPWASARHHAFILQGMRDNAAAARRLGVSYWPFVETPGDGGRGLVRKLAAGAVCVVTDDYPAYIVPAHNRALAARCDAPVILVDGNSIVPLSLLGGAVSAAAHLRPRIHKLFAEAWAQRAAGEPEVPRAARAKLDPPFRP